MILMASNLWIYSREIHTKLSRDVVAKTHWNSLIPIPLTHF